MRFTAVALLIAAASVVIDPSPARASLGYELDASKPSRSLSGAPRGIAVDQTSQDIYVAIVSSNPASASPGQINRFNSDLTADGVFAAGGGFYTGIAVNPLTQDFYASQIKLDFPFGSFGTPKLDRFSPSGTPAGSFVLGDAGSLPPIATDSTGRIFYPNTDAGSIQIFTPAGALQETITCAACQDGSFGRPLSVALNSDDDLYVADFSPDRVVKLTKSGGSYSYDSTLQTDLGAAAVAVNPATDDVFVGDLPNGRDYHVIAYTSAGVQFDDFGGGLLPDPPPDANANLAYQMAVNATTHKLYAAADNEFYVFEKTTIDPPTAMIKPATNVRQLGATLNASVAANGHAALSCTVEYTTAADVGFASATTLPCPQNPDGLSPTQVAASVTGLSTESEYRYRLKVTTNAGSATTEDETFETLPEVLPSVTTGPAEAITQTGATITATANPHGGSVSSCRFEFGVTTAYGTNLPCAPALGAVVTDVSTTRKLSGLIPGTEYHYRLVVTTNAGTTEGDDVAFTTVPPDPEPEPEVPILPQPPAPPVVNPQPPTGPIVTRPPLRCKKGFRKKRVRGKVRCVKKRRPARRNNRQDRS